MSLPTNEEVLALLERLDSVSADDLETQCLRREGHPPKVSYLPVEPE